MGEPFMGELRMMSFDFAPRGWAMCNGQLLPINQNQALFSLLGNTFGGDERVTFALPDLRNRVPIHEGQGFARGSNGGEVAHTITQSELPQHVHLVRASAANADLASPVGNVFAQTSQLYGAPDGLTTLDPGANGSVGGGQPHTNMQPYTKVNFCIALTGVFPSYS
jgi:microcystin-dependent protein